MSPRRVIVMATAGAIVAAASGCAGSDELAQALVTERNQLRREVAGLQLLDSIARSGLLADDREVLVSVRDTLVGSLLSAALPITRDLARGVRVELTGTSMAFRSNVARVEVTGTVRRTVFPRAVARLTLSGALQEFQVDSNRRLHARIALDDVQLSTPTGVPGALGPSALRLLQGMLDRALPELAASLPDVELPVQVAGELALPAIAPGGAISIAGARTPLRLSASKVIAVRDRLTVVLRLERGVLQRVEPDTTAARTAPPPS
jgi:hypothetical protein